MKASFLITWGTFVRLHPESLSAVEEFATFALINDLFVPLVSCRQHHFISPSLMMSVMQTVAELWLLSLLRLVIYSTDQNAASAF